MSKWFTVDFEKHYSITKYTLKEKRKENKPMSVQAVQSIV